MADFLVIDDSLIMRKNIKSILESMGHQVVGELENGAGVIEKYKECQPDIITLDLVMPQVGGLEALQKIKNQFSAVKVIIITCLGKKSEILKALNLGADYYIVKPIEIEDVVGALNSILDEENDLEQIEGQIEVNNNCNCSQEDILLGESTDHHLQKKRKKDVENRLKKELEELEVTEEENNNKLEEKLDDISSGLDEMNDLKPFKVTNEAGRLKIKVNKSIDEKMIKLINEMIENFLVIDSLKITFDLREVDFTVPKLEAEFEKIINKIEVIGGETKVISSN